MTPRNALQISALAPVLASAALAALALAACGGRVAEAGTPVGDEGNGPPATENEGNRPPAVNAGRGDEGVGAVADAGSTGKDGAAGTPDGSTSRCKPFDLEAVMAAGGDWSLAERVMGAGWLRIRMNPAWPTRGTARYLPENPTDRERGIFSCAPRSTAVVEVDGAKRQVHLVFPAPCSSYLLDVAPDTCATTVPGAQVFADFAMTQVSTGIVSTEGILTAFPTATVCDASFTRCAYP